VYKIRIYTDTVHINNNTVCRHYHDVCVVDAISFFLNYS